MNQRVVIVGGGVGGLTAAHELVERGFEVHLYERRNYFGGKAASVRFGNEKLPGEHGFRFYPGWYKHLPDTLGRIPYRGARQFYEGGTVLDNLVAVPSDDLTWYNREPIRVLMHFPRGIEEARVAVSVVGELRRLGLAPGEVAFFARKMAEFLATPETKRLEKYDGITWWEFLEADKKSRAFQDLITATTRTMVAAKATHASAYTIGHMAVRTLFDTLGTVDRVLNGPTNEVWIEPWIEFLKSRGVVFHEGLELDAISFQEGTTKIESLSFTDLFGNSVNRLSRHLGDLLARFEELEILGSSVQAKAERTRIVAEVLAGAQRAHELANAIRESLPEDYKIKIAPELDAVDAALKEIAVPLLLAPSVAATRVAAKATARAGKLAARGDAGAQRAADAAAAAWKGAQDALDDCTSRRADAESKVKEASERKAGAGTDVWRWCDDQEEEAEARLKIAKFAEKEARALADLAEKASQDAKAASDAPRDANKAGEAEKSAQAAKDRAAPRKYEDVLSGAKASVEKLDKKYLAEVEKKDHELKGRNLQNDRVTADFFVFALPLEQMAYYVNRTTMMTVHDPELRRIVLLAEHTDWMAGIQFFLREPVDLGPGHIVCMDSEWGLTAIEETQFWRDVQLPTYIKGIISVDIAAWDQRGRFVRKEAFNCTDEEIALEIWSEMKASVNRDTRIMRLRDEMLRGGGLIKNVSYFLDAAIADLNDRKKQALYEKARSVRFSADELVDRQKRTGYESDTPYIWGRRLRFNVEPLLVNRVGAHVLRPAAHTQIDNMFLASDYVSTQTDLACMESANEAARHAVNALLEAAGSSEKRCQTWTFSPPRDLLDRLMNLARMGDGFGVVAGATKAAGKVADTVFGAAGRAATGVLGKWRRD